MGDPSSVQNQCIVVTDLESIHVLPTRGLGLTRLVSGKNP